jgi:phosphocarrier protein HPr
LSLNSREVTICNARGLHARAAAKFIAIVNDHDARVQVCRDGETVDASSIMDLLMLAAGQGSQITISTEGPDADSVLAALVKLVENRFDEGE